MKIAEFNKRFGKNSFISRDLLITGTCKDFNTAFFFRIYQAYQIKLHLQLTENVLGFFSVEFCSSFSSVLIWSIHLIQYLVAVWSIKLIINIKILSTVPWNSELTYFILQMSNIQRLSNIISAQIYQIKGFIFLNILLCFYDKRQKPLILCLEIWKYLLRKRSLLYFFLLIMSDFASVHLSNDCVISICVLI